jgi:hypothetical protein
MVERLVKCPQCNNEVQLNYRFCTSCGFKLWQTWTGRNLSMLFGSVEPGENVHSLAKYKLWRIGNELGFHAVTEFVPSNIVIQQRSELISVVWKSGDNVAFAFETRAKEGDLATVDIQDDINKLRKLECPKKFVVNVSTNTGKGYFNEITDKSIAFNQVFSYTKTPDHKIVLNLPKLNEIVERFGVVSPGKDVRRQAVAKLLKIGAALGFSPYENYEVPNLLNDGKTRFISVVWMAGNEIAVAFQVRRKRLNPQIMRSRNDRRKLHYLQAKEKYIVNVSEKTGKPYFFGEAEWSKNQFESLKPTQNLQKQQSSSKLEDVKHARAYEPWTGEEDIQLTEKYNNGATVFQLAKKHQRSIRAIVSRLKKLDLVECHGLFEDFKPNIETTVTVLVKSEKHSKVCLACIDNRKRWIRPIKAGGFDDRDILKDNGETLQIFDVVNMNFRTPFPIKHHRENMLLNQDFKIKFIQKLSEREQSDLLSEIANSNILRAPTSKEELYDELELKLRQSLVLAGPINRFEIQGNALSGKTHPRIWIVGDNSQRIFSITCTDLRFCRFIGKKLTDSKGGEGIIRSQDVTELKNKKTYFVIGLTGDSLDENNEIRDGKFAPPEKFIQPRYWPMVVSVLTVPDYCEEGVCT